MFVTWDFQNCFTDFDETWRICCPHTRKGLPPFRFSAQPPQLQRILNKILKEHWSLRRDTQCCFVVIG
jgi:hypothetical protein